ncbi:hypothetical protein TWF481_010072 [Arthrobotrys musiformis]|uniref:Uncharacterized protein n=1 Tax=Arthrobotrys musiformis TaxID=47236 RepID=A0AAV9W1J7_9PEZI
MRFSIKFEISFREGAGDDHQREEGRGGSESPAATSRSWRDKARKVWARLKGPKKETKKDEVRAAVEALTRRITELEEGLAQQGAEIGGRLVSLETQLTSIFTLLLATRSRNEKTSTCGSRSTERAESPNNTTMTTTTMTSSRDGQPSTAPVIGGQHEVVGHQSGTPTRFRCCPQGGCKIDAKIDAMEGIIRPEVSWSSLRTYRTSLSSGSGR